MTARERASQVIRNLVGRGMNFEEIVQSIRHSNEPGRGLPTAVLYNIYNAVIQSRLASTAPDTQGNISPGLMGSNPFIPMEFQYVVIASIVCPDGTHDSYPIYIDSDSTMTIGELIDVAKGIINQGLSTKYQRLAKWDVNRRTGNECLTSFELVESWKKGEFGQ